jgi:hypothetical protein
MKKKIKGLLALGLFSILIIIALVYLSGGNSIPHTKPKAAILDMLYSKLPNENFDKNATKDLQDAGYQVDLYKTSNITIDLYKKLPQMNYKFLVFRTHGLHNGTIESSSSIFSGEIYSTEKHFMEQLAKQVGKAVPYTRAEINARGGFQGLENQTYFTIGSSFVEENMVGKFPGSIILIGGCDALSNTYLAKALVARGAFDVIGWDNLVSGPDNDLQIINVLDEITKNKQSPEDATKTVMNNFKTNSTFVGKLVHYS